MKNHSTNSVERKKYILSYTISYEQIELQLANNTTYNIPYTKENEEMVKSIMEKQAKDAALSVGDISWLIGSIILMPSFIAGLTQYHSNYNLVNAAFIIGIQVLAVKLACVLYKNHDMGYI